MREVNRQELEQRRMIIIGVMFLFFGILVYGFVQLQVTKKDFYTQKSINNSVQKVTTLPVRGLIIDSKNRILVDNNATFYVAVIPKVISDSTTNHLSRLLNLDINSLNETIKNNLGLDR